jgi:putative Mg2+ transporter-C (MgtC) family protein
MIVLATLSLLDAHFDQWASNLGWPGEAFLRLGMAIVAGGLVGLERELRGRSAGFRTNLLVCLGSALVMLVSSQVAMRPWHVASNEYTIRVDPGRIAYGVMTGIGFLGAGVIVKGNTGAVRGLTTAAGLWCVAAIGLAAGLGMYSITVVTTLFVLISLWILDIFEDQLPKLRYRNVVIRRRWKAGCITETIARFKSSGLRVVDASFERRGALDFVDITLNIAFKRRDQYYNLERQLEQDDDYVLMAAREL